MELGLFFFFFLRRGSRKSRGSGGRGGGGSNQGYKDTKRKEMIWMLTRQEQMRKKEYITKAGPSKTVVKIKTKEGEQKDIVFLKIILTSQEQAQGSRKGKEGVEKKERKEPRKTPAPKDKTPRSEPKITTDKGKGKKKKKKKKERKKLGKYVPTTSTLGKMSHLVHKFRQQLPHRSHHRLFYSHSLFFIS